MINLSQLEVLPNEIWKLHEIGVAVSNLGRVYLLDVPYHKAHYTYGSIRDKKKKTLSIRWNYKNYSVHRLVAQCFLPNPNNYLEVDHIDRNPSNNKVSNLRWANRSINLKNRGKFTKPNTPKNNAKSKKVLMIDVNTNEIIKVWESISECGRNGFVSSNISKCCRGERNFHKGYKWQYA